MEVTKKWLEENDACEEGIKWFVDQCGEESSGDQDEGGGRRK